MRSNALLVCIAALCVLASLHGTRAANILCLLGAPQPGDISAHQAWWHDTLLPKLHAAGHNLTVLTSIVPSTVPDKNIHFVKIALPTAIPPKPATKSRWSPSHLWSGSVYEQIVHESSAKMTTDTLLIETPGVQHLLNYSSDFKFHLILHDPAQSQVLLGFVQHFRYAPLLSVSGSDDVTDATLAALTGVETHAIGSYVPHRFSPYASADGLTLVERARNWSYHQFEWFYRRFVYMQNANRKARRLFGDSVQSLELLERRSEMVLVNVVVGLDAARPLSPNVRTIGGAQAQRNQTVAEDLQRFLDASNYRGVVYVNLGLKLDDHRRRLLSKAFAAMPEYDFVWYTEKLRLNFLPRNVFSSDKLLPQARILAHPNVRLMLTHGGRLSVQEAVWNALPMLGIQHSNKQPQLLERAHLAQCAELLPCDDSEQIARTIRKMLDDVRYANKAREFWSTIYGAQLNGPLKTIMHAIDYVLRVGNARHLQLRNEHLYIHQMHLLDVGLIAAVLWIGFVIIIVRNCCGCKSRDLSAGGDVKTKVE